MADFVAELISGEQANPPLCRFGDPRERELWLEFKNEMRGNDISRWLYQGAETPPGRSRLLHR